MDFRRLCRLPETKSVPSSTFRFFDKDENGLINFREWILAVDAVYRGDFPTRPLRYKLNATFERYNQTGSGFITKNEMHMSLDVC